MNPAVMPRSFFPKRFRRDRLEAALFDLSAPRLCRTKREHRGSNDLGFAEVADLPSARVVATLTLARLSVQKNIEALNISVKYAHIMQLLQPPCYVVEYRVFPQVNIVRLSLSSWKYSQRS